MLKNSFRFLGSKLFYPLINLLVKYKVNPNTITFFSMISVMLAFYYLFYNHVLFVIFSLFHWIFDSLDGQVARKSKKTTKFGFWFDHLVDRLYSILMLLKFGFLFNPKAFVTLAVFIIYQLINLINRKYFYFRTFILIGFMLTLFGLTVRVLTVLLLIGTFYQIILIIKKYIIRYKP